MTRINVVPVEELCDQHLLAEHRELTRIPNCLISGKYKWFDPERPLQYKLGEGHIKFFTGHVGWLYQRYQQLHQECLNRGFKVQNIWPAAIEVPPVLYEPTEEALLLNRERILERWPQDARYRGAPAIKPNNR